MGKEMENSGMAGQSLFSMTEAFQGRHGAGFEPGSFSSDVFYPKECLTAAQEDDRPEWICVNCGTKNKGMFCEGCGSPGKDEQ